MMMIMMMMMMMTMMVLKRIKELHNTDIRMTDVSQHTKRRGIFRLE
jgi:hypothetical protein